MRKVFDYLNHFFNSDDQGVDKNKLQLARLLAVFANQIDLVFQEKKDFVDPCYYLFRFILGDADAELSAQLIVDLLPLFKGVCLKPDCTTNWLIAAFFYLYVSAQREGQAKNQFTPEQIQLFFQSLIKHSDLPNWNGNKQCELIEKDKLSQMLGDLLEATGVVIPEDILPLSNDMQFFVNTMLEECQRSGSALSSLSQTAMSIFNKGPSDSDGSSNNAEVSSVGSSGSWCSPPPSSVGGSEKQYSEGDDESEKVEQVTAVSEPSPCCCLLM